MRLLIDDACKKGNVDQPINLTKQGYKPNDPCEEGFTPFIYITFAAQVDACDALITSQADINVQNGYDWNITHVCSLIDKDREGLLLECKERFDFQKMPFLTMQMFLTTAPLRITSLPNLEATTFWRKVLLMLTHYSYHKLVHWRYILACKRSVHLYCLFDI